MYRTRERNKAVLFVLIALAALPFACSEGADDSTETATIAPATPEPNVDIDNDPALTQTIDPGENRSPYEGGPLGEDEVIGGEPDEGTVPEREEPPSRDLQ